jgi:hypothetical protein
MQTLLEYDATGWIKQNFSEFSKNYASLSINQKINTKSNLYNDGRIFSAIKTAALFPTHTKRVLAVRPNHKPKIQSFNHLNLIPCHI